MYMEKYRSGRNENDSKSTRYSVHPIAENPHEQRVLAIAIAKKNGSMLTACSQLSK